DQALPEGQTALGICYMKGEGVEQDYKRAYSLFQEAAKQKYPEAQFQLGVMYYGGEGVQANNKEAVKWFRMAAEQGHCPAQLNLGICYYEGTGVPMDNLESYYWLSLAANLCPPQYADEYNKTRDKVKAELNENEIEKADIRVKEWMYKNKQ
ncbi:MAG: tetratricopeptide repeat protein, partial [Candidatus Cloacimonadaceae bacterium]